jgi:hypothetical protein
MCLSHLAVVQPPQVLLHVQQDGKLNLNFEACLQFSWWGEGG